MKDKKQPKEKLKSQSSDGSVDEKELLFQITNDLMLYLDLRGRITKINRAGIAFSGFSEDEMIGQLFWKIPGVFSKRNIPKYLKVLKNTIRGEPTESFLSELHEKSGKKHIMEFSTFPIKENRKITSILVVGKDITEQKESENKLHETGEKYHLITENTSDLISLTTFTLNPTYTYASPSHEKIVGYVPENLIGKPCFDLVHPDDKKKLFSLLRKYIGADGKKFLTEKGSDVSETIQYRFKDKSGNWHYLESTVDIAGSELLIISKDFTERRRIEKNYKILFNSSPYAIMLLTEDGEILNVNLPMAKSLGISIKEVVGKNIHNILPKDVGKKRTVVARKALETGEIQENGDERDERYFHNSFVPIFISDGRKGIQVISRDITKRKNAEEKISKLNECFLSLGSDARKNIEMIANAAGGILGGACILYNRLEKERGLLCTWGIWNEPEGYKAEDNPEGHICYDVIKNGRKGSVIIENLEGSKYEKTDPNVKKYKLKSYLGYPIRLKGEAVGSFCLCGVKKRKFTQDEIKIMSMLAQAIANEERRKLAQEELRDSENKFRKMVSSAQDAVVMIDSDGRTLEWNTSAEKMFGYRKKEILGKKIHPIIASGRYHKEYLAGVKIFQKTGKGPLMDKTQELVGLKKDGIEFPIELSLSAVKIKGTWHAMGIIRDITDRKNAEESLQKAHDELEERVTERTAELSRTNEVLQIEITEHNKAEEEIKRTKDYLDNVIDSASEFMLVVDMNYKVSTWNKTAERLTGYKKREVLRRSINSLDVFLNSKDLQDDIKNIQNGVKIPFNELILRSKTGAKKLVRASGSIVMESSANQTGVLFVGKEITQDSEMRGKLLQGNSYLITDKSNTSALNLLVDLSVSGSDGLFITRGNPNVIQSMFQSVDTKVIMLSRDKCGGFENISSLDKIAAKIKEFVAKKSKPVVLIDRVDYLLTNFSFEAFVKSLYEINNIISTHNAILLMRVNSDILNASQLAFIEEELKPLPSQRIDAVELDDQVYGVLTFIDKQNKNNVLVSFKKISQEFSISKVTTAKRLNMLDDRGLIFIKKQGKSKTVHISDKGKLLLSGREAV